MSNSNFSVLVCDDSNVARKQVVRCLGDCISADIKQASNGRFRATFESSQASTEKLELLMKYTSSLLQTQR
jgi:CheY-like chemotaxis protein